MRARRAGVVAALASLVVTGLGSVPADAATIPSTGNAATIAFYRSVVAATARMRGREETMTGYTALQDSAGRFGWTFSLKYGFSYVPANYLPATEHVTVAASEGKVIWVSDEMGPRCPPRPGSGVYWCGDFPLLLLFTSTGMVGHLLGFTGSLGCWATLSGGSVAFYSKVGVPSGYTMGGHFDPMHRVGADEVATSTFSWSKPQQATEIDTVPVAIRLPTSSGYHISAGGPSCVQLRYNGAALACCSTGRAHGGTGVRKVDVSGPSVLLAEPG